ncbi:hypothetical protein COS81_04355 [candidate division WWE3 bacterium CG06_land_8_20_14_3_00_42_16]|uniref:EamA domain-containing protein n=2 Tax=Katanobacteria TaxID=422282 RepID=A0A2M7ALR6_UNCKA|nr:MAG: hypothetical protein AUJ38_04035 [bacterium CG1_02_42_9]PIU68338.1 MAG: hypothetical protein COS81_04355 [candidate division WWE3 bacterium CG06_land_8_20_14_3_00_42_16]PJC69458.1 MAG: hypothetical protein CO015_00180 [candidate division WWE3 bacterium CG_4_8_14_3_um_filter_42_11]
MPWIIFAIAAPFFYTITNFIEKFVVENKIKNPIILAIFGGFISLIVGLLIFILKGAPLLETSQLILILISGLLLEFYLIPYFLALSLDDASRVVPLFQFAPVFVLILSFVVLGEHLTGQQLGGFILIVVGGFILGIRKLNLRIFALRKSLYLMLISSFLYGLVLILFRYVVSEHDFWVTFSYEAIGVGLGALILLGISLLQGKFRQEIKKVDPKAWKILLTNSGIGLLAELSQFYALLFAPASLVSVIGGVQPFFVFMIGLFLSLRFPHLIKEDLSRPVLILKGFSILLIFVGTYFIFRA